MTQTRLTATFFAVLALSFLVAPTASAQQVSVTTDDVVVSETQTGETFTVPIRVSNLDAVSDVESYQFDLGFSTDQLVFEEFRVTNTLTSEAGFNVSQSDSSDANSSGTATLGAFSTGTPLNAAGDSGVLVRAVFTLDGTQNSTGNIQNVTFNGGDIGTDLSEADFGVLVAQNTASIVEDTKATGTETTLEISGSDYTGLDIKAFDLSIQFPDGVTAPESGAATVLQDGFSTSSSFDSQTNVLTISSFSQSGNELSGDGTIIEVDLNPVSSSGTYEFTFQRDQSRFQDTNGNEVDVTLADGILTFVGNEAPTAVADSFSTPRGEQLTVQAPGVLGNDSDPDGDSLSASLVSGVSNGSLTLNGDGSFTYTPSSGFVGTDSFEYAAADQFGAADTTTVTVAVESTSPIALDGQLNESEYIPLGTNVDSADGFSPTNDVDSLVYYPDEENQMLNIAVAGTLETDNVNGYALFLNVEGSGAPTGAAAGDTLGFPNETTDYHFLSKNGGNTNFTADFEVDYVIAASPTGAPDTTAAVAASYMGTSRSATIVGITDESGTPVAGTGANGETIRFAHLNSEAPLTGAEFQIPFSEIGASASNNVQVFAVIVSASGYFSNETIPGNATRIADSKTDGGGNPGFNAQWSTYAGGPYHTGGDGLPVELASFEAIQNESSVQLRWQTASETNNAGFRVEHSAPGQSGWSRLGYVESKASGGTTTEAKSYSYAIRKDLAPGTHRVRLRQVDLDGSATTVGQTPVEVQMEEALTMTAPSPNPTSGQATLSFGVKKSQKTEVVVYNVLGQQVKTLYEGTPQGGQPQRLSFDASQLPSGTYFVQVRSEGHEKTTRLTVLR